MQRREKGHPMLAHRICASSQFPPNPSRICIYEKRARNPFRICSYKLLGGV